MKPIKRSGIRIKAGKAVYTFLRYINWIFSEHKFAKRKDCGNLLPFTVFGHSSPLIRELRGLDDELQYNKIKNLGLSIGKINGVILEPGEIFSFWRLTGKPTSRKGYLDGLVLYSGGLGRGVGGGLCQLTNLIYWMTLHTPLDVVERYRHSYEVFPDSNRTQPFGTGATCVYNYRDLIIKNPTGKRFQLNLYMDDKRLYGSWLCDTENEVRYEVYERNHRICPEYWGGYTRHNEIRRKTFDMSGNVLSDEALTENHAAMMYQPFLAENKAE